MMKFVCDLVQTLAARHGVYCWSNLDFPGVLHLHCATGITDIYVFEQSVDVRDHTTFCWNSLALADPELHTKLEVFVRNCVR